MGVDVASFTGDSALGEAGSQPDYRQAIAAFADIAIGLREAIDRDEMLHLVARKMCELVGVSRCSLYLRDERTGLYRGQVGHADHDIDPLVKRLTGGVEADRFTREIVRTRAPVVISDARRDQRAVRSTMRSWRVRSMMGVPMVLRDEVIGIIFLDSEEEVRTFSELDRDLASAFAELAAAAISHDEVVRELRDSHAMVARQNGALRRAAAVDERFTRLVISGGSLREIAEAVTELTNRPCLIFNGEMKLLARAAGGEEEAGAPFDERSLQSPEVARAIAELEVDRPSVVGPFRRAGVGGRLLVAPVTVRDERWANLILVEQASSFTDFDGLITRRVASIVALEMSAEHRATLAERNARSSLAAELVRGNRDVAQLERRANFLGIPLDTPHVLSLLTWRDGDELKAPDAEAVAAALLRFKPERSILTTSVAEGVVAITELPGKRSLQQEIEEVKGWTASACAAIDPHGRLIAGISMCCSSATDYARAYEQARQVASCIDAYSPTGRVQVLSAADLGAGRLLLAAADPAETRRFVQDTVGALLVDDVPAELLETLVCFFDSSRSVRRSAVALDVHENTIRYRLSRIEELTGLDLTADSDAQLSAQIALLVLRLEGLLPGADAEPAAAG